MLLYIVTVPYESNVDGVTLIYCNGVCYISVSFRENEHLDTVR